MLKRLQLLMALGALAMTVSAAPAWAASYSFTSFDGPNSTAGTTVDGINNNDQIVGFSVDNNDTVTNWVRNTNGGFNILNVPMNSFANGINITPTVVGQTDNNAFSYSGGVYSQLPNFNGSTTAEIAFGINDKGTIVGQFTDGVMGTSPGFVYSGGVFTALNPIPNATVTNAQGINNNGLVAGFYSTDGVHQHGFFYDTKNNSYQLAADPNVQDFVFSQLLGINDNGIVAGYYGTTNGSQHGFLYNIATGTYTFMDDPLAANIGGVEITQITGIADDGEITGFYVGADGLQQGFYATQATPEPSSLLLMGSGVLGLAGVVRRKFRV